MNFNMPACIDKYADIAQAMGVDISAMDKQQAAEAAVKAVQELSIRVGISQKLSELNITAEDIPALAAQAIQDVCTPGNPREVTEEQIIALYTAVL